MGKRNKNEWGLYDPRAPWNVSPISYLSPIDRDQWILKNGSFGWDDEVELRHKSTRAQYARSPNLLIPGTQSFFRKPTAYERWIYQQVTTQKLHYLRYTTAGVNTGEQRITPLPTTAISSALDRIKGHGWKFYHSTNRSEFDDPDVDNARKRAVTECLVKLGDNKVDVGTALAEASKTVHHLADTAVDIAKAYSALRGKRWRDLLTILSKRSPLHSRKIIVGATAAKYWLEYNYAWKPLFYEAYGLVELLKSQLEPALLVHANRTVHGRLDHQIPPTPRGPGTGSWYGIHVTMSGRVKYESTCRISARISSTAMKRAAMGLTNPAAVLWELVPYSFVVDWAIPIGNVLEAATATRGLTFVGGSKTTRYQSSGRVTFLGKEYHIQLREGQAEVFKYRMVREVLNGFPEPVLYSKSPFSTTHIISALALVRQLL